MALPGIIIAAPSEEEDYVCRYFAPQKGIDEDPLTGTAHCTVAPLFAAEHLKNQLNASQLSQSGVTIGVEVKGNKINLTGKDFIAMEINIFDFNPIEYKQPRFYMEKAINFLLQRRSAASLPLA